MRVVSSQLVNRGNFPIEVFILIESGIFLVVGFCLPLFHCLLMFLLDQVLRDVPHVDVRAASLWVQSGPLLRYEAPHDLLLAVIETCCSRGRSLQLWPCLAQRLHLHAGDRPRSRAL